MPLFRRRPATPISKDAEANASFLSRITYSWINPLIILGCQTPLQHSHLPHLLPVDTASASYHTFTEAYRAIAASDYHHDTKSSPDHSAEHHSFPLRVALRLPRFFTRTARAVGAACGSLLFRSALWKPLWTAAAVSQIFVIRELVSRISPPVDSDVDVFYASRWRYIPLAAAMALCSVFMSISQHALFYASMRAGMQAKAILSAHIYDKMLRLHPCSQSRYADGFVANLQLTDVQRVLDGFSYFHFCWYGFIELVLVSGLLCIILGRSALFGVLILVLLVPTQIYFSVLISRARKRTTQQSDVRVQKMTELLAGMRVVKFCAWERHFEALITELRKKEVRHLKVASVVRALNASLFFTAPVLVALVSFASFTLLERQRLTPEITFASVGFFSLLSRVLSMMPAGFLALAEARIALMRLDSFFELPENAREDHRLDVYDALCNAERASSCENTEAAPGMGTLESNSEESEGHFLVNNTIDTRVVLRNCCFAFTKIEDDRKRNLSPVLSDISFSVRDGELFTIVGSVASGKTSLLLGVLEEIVLTSGSVAKRGSVAYCAQQPWIINGTLRENITIFGDPDVDKNHHWYNQVIERCCLITDIDALPAGDVTEIGERGVNLSGGQKARVALARAVYANADIYLLDDPLSAVDSAVSSKLLMGVFGPHGLLASKAQIMVTHQIHALPVSSKVLVLEDGKALHFGTYEQLRAQGVEFSGFSGMENEVEVEKAAQVGFGEVETNASYENERLDITLVVASSTLNNQARKGEQTPLSPSETYDSSNAKQSEEEDENSFVKDKEVDRELGSQGRLVIEEDRRVGRVTANVYKAYIKAGGGYPALILCFVLFALAQASRQGAEAWLGIWSTVDSAVREDNSVGENEMGGVLFERNRFHSLIYFAFAMVTAFLTILRAATFAERTMTASKRLHNQLLDRILRATMTFFDTNPLGRILNRFSKDIDQMDVMLPTTEQEFLQIAFLALGALSTIAAIIPWFLIPMPFIVLVFGLLQRMYKSSSRELKRIDGVSRSPIYAQHVETMIGLATVRAFEAGERFSAVFKERLDANNQAYHTFNVSGRWLGFRLDILSVVIVFTTSFVVLIVSPSLNQGLGGVALTQSIVLTGLFQWGVRQAAETENLFTSVERVSNMASMTPIEKPQEIPETRPPNDWPSKGVISFEEVEMRYRPELEPALRGISFKIGSRERIGIVGRTGSGKSSLFVCLFRMVELSSGCISIDDRDISTMGLRDLRSRMAIVPQEPVLFTGTIRENLDPKGIHDDASLWDALHRVNMTDAVEGNGLQNREGHGLELMVDEKGSNFSVGERQLLALARAILSGVKTVVLDEASASLDNHTDMLIQRAVREQLKDRTVLTIAHRLATIADSDRVLVLDGGSVVEFDTPEKLMQRKGHFAKLVEETGEVESSILKSIIADSST